MATLIRGGTVVNHDHSRRADVLIDGEKIIAIGTNLEAPKGADVIDAGGAYIMPGGNPHHNHQRPEQATHRTGMVVGMDQHFQREKAKQHGKE